MELRELLLLLNLLAIVGILSYKLGFSHGHDVGHSHAEEESYGEPNE